MSNYSKLIIYYHPSEKEKSKIKSLTLSFSRLNDENDTYRQKLILQQNINNKIEEYKIKEFHLNAEKIKEKIRKIDFEREYDKVNDLLEEYYLIKFNNKEIKTNNHNQIKYILDIFNFDDLMQIQHYHYKYIKDMYEFVSINNLLNAKAISLDKPQMLKLVEILKVEDPYRIFRNMIKLDEFINQYNL